MFSATACLKLGDLSQVALTSEALPVSFNSQATQMNCVFNPRYHGFLFHSNLEAYSLCKAGSLTSIKPWFAAQACEKTVIWASQDLLGLDKRRFEEVLRNRMPACQGRSVQAQS